MSVFFKGFAFLIDRLIVVAHDKDDTGIITFTFVDINDHGKIIHNSNKYPITNLNLFSLASIGHITYFTDHK